MSAVNRPTLPVSEDRVLVDAHVHFHRCFDPGVFLESAMRNFQRAAGQLGLHPETPGCLLLADCRGEDSLSILLERSGRRTLGEEWVVSPNGEDGVLLASRDGMPPMAIVAGRQIATRDGLEVLALNCTVGIPDGISLEEAVAEASRANALTVLPWGFGKWWFRRGRLVRRLLESADPRQLFIGDNGARCAALGEPSLLQWARSRGFTVLPGTDPFPFASQATRVGGYGFCLEGPFDRARAGAAIAGALRSGSGRVQVFGRLTSAAAFIVNQVGIRVYKPRKRAGEGSLCRNKITIALRET